MNYWLMKSEPDAFGIDDLKLRPQQTEPWDGVRNYQARNMLRDEMQGGDLAFFYHSNCTVPGIAGVMSVVRAGYPDTTALNPESKYHDPKSTPDNPRWFRVDVRYKRKLKRVISLAELKAHPALRDLALLRSGNRLPIMPLSKAHWDIILSLE